MSIALEHDSKLKPNGAEGKVSAFGYPRDFLGHHFVYIAISPRARGLSVGLNLTPDKLCNFDCAYCEVDWRIPDKSLTLDLGALSGELETTLALVSSGRLQDLPLYSRLPADLLRLR